MLSHEAKWFARQLADLAGEDLFPLLNVGSQTEEFRAKQQPWIDRYVFAPLRRQNRVVKHLDLQDAPGVDLVGDLTDKEFLRKLAAMRFRSAFCSNLLEHVANREEIAATVTSVVVPGGYLFVSCPYRFPYHPDPIDTLYRPGVEELAALFPGTRIHRQEILNCGTLIGYIIGRLRHPLVLAGSLRKKPDTAPTRVDAVRASPLRYVPWLFKRFQATCLVLQKIASGP